METRAASISITFAIVLLTLLGGLAATTASANGGQSYGCNPSARAMMRACWFDVGDDMREGKANCQQISDRRERQDCIRETRVEAREELTVCRDQRDARLEACDILDEDVYEQDPLLDPAVTFIDPDDIPGMYPVNPYVSLEAGHTYVLRAGEDFEETVVVTVTEDSRDIQGVLCRIVVDIVVEESEKGGEYEYEAIEVTDDWFAQDANNNVYYCGEVARNFEDGILRDLDGSFESGIDSAKAGVLIKAFPFAGDAHRQEFALGEAEDVVAYEDLATAPGADEGGDNLAFPCTPDLCLKTFDFAPLEPESSEYKYYIPGTGFVLGVGVEDGEVSGERDELKCIGDSIDVLQDPACGISDPDALLEELCKLSPDAFCSD